MYDEIFICVNDIELQPEALVAASKFSERFSAVLNGSYLKLDAADLWGWQRGDPMALAKQFLADQEAREDLTKAEFDALTQKYACHTTWNTLSKYNDHLKRSICSDIIFANQPQKSDSGSIGTLPYINRLIIESHRPVIMIPHNWGEASIGSRVLLGWNSSPEAMRATSDAMPILQTADSVMVVDIVKEHMFQTADDLSPGIETYLNSKNVAHVLSVIHADAGRNGEQLALSKFANDNDVDLIVVGGYGHSRLTELILGGMTKHLIENSTVPVLFSH